MVAWYLDEGAQVLKTQWLEEHPGAVVYAVGDTSHLEEGNKSQHNPEAAGSLPGQSAGEVDALDFMEGHGVTDADLDQLFEDLVASRDERIFYVIRNRVIVSSVTQPWVRRPYTGSDPHTNHVHLSLNDRFKKNETPWKVGDEVDAADAKQIALAVIKELRNTPEDLSDTERVYIAKEVVKQLAPQLTAIVAAIQADDDQPMPQQQLVDLANLIVLGLPDDLAKKTVDELRDRLQTAPTQ